MRVTQWGEYGVLFSIALAKKFLEENSSLTALELSTEYKTDPLYAQQILQRLRKGGVIQSIRGPQGGYKLSKNPREITLFDILKAAEGDTFEVICEAKPVDAAHRCSSDFNCSLRSIWVDLKDHVNEFLMNKTLVDLLHSETAVMEPLVSINA